MSKKVTDNWTPEVWERYYKEQKEICFCNKEPHEVTDVQYMVNLERLCMADSEIEDLSILEGLINLKELKLHDNNIENLAPLANLQNLEVLHLSDNQVDDLTPLKELKSLTELKLGSNIVTDLTPLTELTKLEGLCVCNNSVDDVTPLAGLTGLKTLCLCNQEIEDISPLENLVNLRYLYLEGNNIEDFSPLINMKKLKNIDVDINSNILNDPGTSGNNNKKCKNIEKYCLSLSEKAATGKIDRIVGRNSETEHVIQILSRRQKNNPCLIGEPGVGKTAIAEGLAMRIHNGDVPCNLKNKEVHLLDLTEVVAAGAKWVGEFEKCFYPLIKEVEEHGNIILFIDEVHNLIGAGAATGKPMDAANILKPALARGAVQVIGATTIDEYREHIETDKALERRFQPVNIEAPSVEETIEIVKGIKDYYESYHNVKISDDVAEHAVKLADKYISNRFFPDKAIDLIDEACSNLNLKRKPGQKRNPVMAKDNLARVIELWTKIPACSISEDDRAKLFGLESQIKANIIGQDSAIEKVCAAIKRKRLGISKKHKPVSFIFVGSTGIGKTEVVKQLATNLFHSKDAFIRLDMSEYKDPSSETKIIGAAPGFVNNKKGGQLTEKVRKNPYSIILLDEIEKAHPMVMDLFLQILDEGHITDGLGRKIDFKNTIIIMTSNAGSIDKVVGFNKTVDERTIETTKSALKNFLKPEFINRVDEVIHFNHLTKENIKMIARLMLDELCESILEQQPITLTYNDSVIDYLAENTDFETYGARNLYHLIQKEIEDKIAAEMLADCEAVITMIDLSVLDDIIKVGITNKIVANSKGIKQMTIHEKWASDDKGFGIVRKAKNE